MNSMRISLVLLTFNEIDGVRALLPQLSKIENLNVDEVFAVDGGSKDGTLEEYQKYGVQVLKQTSRGRGEAMRLAARHSTADYLVFFSPDGNEDLNDIAKFRKYFEAGHDLVIASRMMKGAVNEEDHEILRFRKWANNAFNFLANLFFRRSGSFVSDSINGFRGVRRSTFLDLNTDALGYTIEYQTTIRCFKTKKSIFEFPTREGSRIGGETKAPSIPTGIRFLKCLWQEIRLGSEIPSLTGRTEPHAR